MIAKTFIPLFLLKNEKVVQIHELAKAAWEKIFIHFVEHAKEG